MEKIVTAIMMFFMVLGALDRAVFRNRFGLGNEFVKGLNSIGPLILGMAGIMCSAPVLGKLLLKLVTPLFGAIGADPAIIAGTCFGLDMGGYYMTASMTNDPSVIMLGGVILSTVLGATIVFTIPVALTLCRPEDASAVSKGIVFGIISIPFGTIAAALASGLTLHYTLINAAPAFVLAALLAAGMIFFPQKTLIIFRAFGNLLQASIILALAAAGVESTLGITVIPGMDPLAEQLETIAMIGITLAGAYPFVHVLSKLLAPVLNVIAKLMGVNGPSVTGMLACLANPLPMYDMIPLMDERGKVLAMAFCTCANAMIGDHFAFISIAYPEGTTATFIVKIVSGAVALLIAALSTKKGGKTH